MRLEQSNTCIKLFLGLRYLIGNPCHDFPGYREYVIAILPQLKQLDGKDIKRSERILARQKFQDVKEMVLKSEEAYFSRLDELIFDIY